MYYIPFLYRLDYTLQAASRIVKSCLLLIPLLVCLFYFEQNRQTQPSESSYTKRIALIKQQQTQNVNMVQIIKTIEQFALSKNIQVLTYKEEKKVLWLTLNVPPKHLLELIEFLELFHGFSKLETIQLNTNNHFYEVEVRLTFLHYYNKPIFISKPKNSIAVKNKKHTLQAIVSPYVLIDEQWYKNKSEINGYTIKIRNANRVELIKQNQRLTLKVYHETE